MGNDDTKSLGQKDSAITANQPTLDGFNTLSHDVLSRYRARDYGHFTLSDEELLVAPSWL